MVARSATNRLGLLALKLLVLATVVWGVGRTLLSGWSKLAELTWDVSWPWVAVAGVLYVFGLLPSAWYWRRSMIALGGRPGWADTLKAYFAGHLAKYVPGKVLVVVLRAGMLPRAAVPLGVGVVGVFLETLTIMTVGAFLVAVLSPVLLELDKRTAAVALAVAVAVGLPTVPPVARGIIRRVMRHSSVGEPAGQGTPPSLEGLNLRLMVEGWLASGLFWTLLATSLGATLNAIGVAGVSSIGQLPVLIAAVALANVAGFVSMLPGGLGVRDAVLVGVLAPRFGDAPALLAAVGLRLIWIVTELAVCGILYVGRRGRRSEVRVQGNSPNDV